MIQVSSPFFAPSMASKILSPEDRDTITTGILKSSAVSFLLHTIFPTSAGQPKELRSSVRLARTDALCLWRAYVQMYNG